MKSVCTAVCLFTVSTRSMSGAPSSPSPPPSDAPVRSLDFAASPDQEKRRLAALHRYEILDTDPEEAFDRITRIASHVFRAPLAFVSLIDEDRQWMKSCVGLQTTEIDLSESFCVYTIQSDEPFIVKDASTDPRFRDNRFVKGEPNIRFYAGAPLRTSDGHRIGTLCVLDTEPRPHVSPDDVETLEHLAALVVDELELRREVVRRRRREADLEAARKEADEARADAEEANDTMARFFAGVAHDLQNPLTSILMLAELLQTLVGAEASGYVHRVQRAGERMQGMVESLLDLGRLRSGILELETHPEEVTGIAQEAMAAAEERPEAASRHARLIAPSQPVWARVDPDALRRVLGNLIGNAFKHTEPDDDVVVRLRQDDDVVVEVEDTGPGIAPEVLDTLFDPFTRGGEDTEGSGLGLAIAHDLIDAMNGSIDVSSTPAQGTCFVVTLPSASG